ncbi:hypothetical protein MVLG_06687 [Microbotryum lychnidis-dioicae p1A1 Lamole]|uniref:AMP-dependent synthetase/ligase domain-containing protein n=1 Tax=Microbotryum lychnidis-dioicae (strain p1A1 Lamole / MvSl-1064) TaxID=683840 RepID=U5HI19_USTV1|nr:hypothetical protein MVLG_06687 [Microbotryum lychnidis-dioicae p1A1 Lamole]|eukprot:KDE02795.1 hypothetical protein MVLG_06687 [Microbotryum lychnidis-dioicae p1A1 Lamole]
MPYNAQTGIYTSALPDAPLPPNLDTISIYDFLFGPVFKPVGPGAVQRNQREDSVWLIDSVTGKTLTYEQAHQRTLDIAKGFKKRGLEEGNTVVIFSPNEVDYATGVWATFRLGGIVSCANPSYTAGELAYQLSMVHKYHPVKLVLASPESLADTLEACKKGGLLESNVILIREAYASSSDNIKNLARKFPTLDDIAREGRVGVPFVQFGTTGLPKAVEIPHRCLIANVLQSTVHWSKRPFTRYDAKTKKGDVIAGILPFFHIYGLVVVLHISVYNNTPVCVIPKFGLESFLGSTQKYKITSLYVVPPIMILLAKNDTTKKFDLSSVRIYMAGAAPLTIEIFQLFSRKFPKVRAGQGYGATESCTIITKLDVAGGSPGHSAGLVFPSIAVKIVSPEGKNLPPGGVGELWSRSPSNAIGYLANEKATKETWDEEGFLHTGDECYIDDSGHMFVVDRIKELIKGFLLDHPLVNDCAVIGIPDDYTGEKPKAFVALPPTEQVKLAKDPNLADEYIASIKKVVADNKDQVQAFGRSGFLAFDPENCEW